MPANCRIASILLSLAVVLAAGQEARACECRWMGPFFNMAPQSRLVVRAVVLRYNGRGKESPPAMDLEVREVYCGEVPHAPLRVWGGDGLLCRPNVTEFPVGSEWVLALDGPGSKPGMTPDHAISICGQFWLRVAGGKVAGNIDDAGDQKTAQELTLGEFRKRLAAALAAANPPGRLREVVVGEVRAGQPFERGFAQRLVFRLEPLPLGWMVTVRERGRDEDLARLTPPLHGVPNPRDIEGWHLRNADNTGPNEPGEKNVNAPGELREFIFSPEVGRTIAGAGAQAGPTPADIAAVRSYGEGELKILRTRFNDLEPGRQAGLEWMRFQVTLSWPRGSEPADNSGCAPKAGKVPAR
jgi:hypothetical protein